FQKPPGRITDGLAPRRRHICGRMFGPINITHRVAVVRRPGVIHAYRKTEIVSRLCGRVWRIGTDRRQGSLVPDPRDAVSGSTDARGSYSTREESQNGYRAGMA